MAKSIHPLIAAFCTACKPADRRPPWQWCEEHIQVDETSPMPGRWRSDSSPWVRAVMVDFANNAIRDITVQCAAQSSKTQTHPSLLELPPVPDLDPREEGRRHGHGIPGR